MFDLGIETQASKYLADDVRVATPPVATLTWQTWLKTNASKFETPWEEHFAKYVLAKVPGLDPSSVFVQRPVATAEGHGYRVDIAIELASVRIAIEIDGYDKRGIGTGESREDFRQRNERETILLRNGWRVLRFSNHQVRTQASRQQCIDAIHADLRQPERDHEVATSVDQQPEPLMSTGSRRAR